MTQGPEYPRPDDGDPSSPYGQQPPSYGQQPPSYGQQPYGQQPYSPYGASPGAPYGVHPTTGIPYSDKSKLVAGLLQLLLPLGIGRLYAGYTGIGIAQLVVTIVTCGIGGLWPFIDGIIILATDSKDANGYMLRS
ncbi:TM2 domain-containing protein [Nocardioides ochotonae]|uniref:TM2 domain-containing protein n=1 Tax=Nocardioides ochotonae TaxID=2685869 RepID=UPI00140B46AA|nr:TM2 domain-containing protein [Nocardioides ochotonae]